MKIVSQGTAVSAPADSARQSACFPNICVLPSGRWLLGYRAAPTKAGLEQTALLTWSDDGGATWCEPREPFTAPTIDGHAGKMRAIACTALGGRRVLATIMWVDCSDMTRAFFNEKTQGLLDCRLFIATSDDEGATWSKLRAVDRRPYDRQPTPITGPTLLLPDGRLGCQFELNNHWDDTSEWRHASVMTFSADEGKTWGDAVETSRHPENRIFYWDQRPGVLADGSVLDLFWTYDNTAGKYINIHARESHDSGRTWSRVWDIGVGGQPAAPVSLPDGHIAMVYVDRDATPCIKLRTSRDRGRTWPADTEVLLHSPSLANQTWQKSRMQDAWAEMGKFSLGLPATAAISGGDVLAVYYSGPQADHTDLQWVRLSPG